jgi:decaprenylphospho-beta-D-erythro-pentofuranosid-2-ulose 2-reductase
MAETVLILGANSDIARAIAHQYASKGYNLYLAARNSSRLEPDVSDIQIRYGREVKILEFDALALDSHQTFYDDISPKPDIVFCVFGLLGDQKIAEQDWKKAREIISVNYEGALSILHHVANEMEARKKGVIVGISSVAGDRGRASNYYYGSAKAGFTAFLSGLRNRLAKKGVRVVTVKPGFVDTAMTEGLDLPGPLTAQPNEVAKAIYKAVKNRRNIVYTRWMWRYIMLIIRNIPEFVFKKLSL